MKPSSLAMIAVIVLVLIGGLLYFVSAENEEDIISTNQSSESENSNQQNQIENTEQPAIPKDATTVSNSITPSEVAVHNTEEDCWTIIDNSVYDITSYVSRHPGGNNILSACGVYATEFFYGEQAGQLGGRNDHSEDNQAVSQLAQFKLGDLAN